MRNKNRDPKDAKKREAAMAFQIELNTTLEVCMMPENSCCDFAMYLKRDGEKKIIALAEFRNRPNILLSTHPEGICINKEKVDKMRLIASHMDIKQLWFMVQTMDNKVWMTSLFGKVYSHGLMNRTKPEEKDKEDEIVYYIPEGDFKEPRYAVNNLHKTA